MRARDQEEIKGIYYNEISGDVYFVNEVKSKVVLASTVVINSVRSIRGILDDNIEIPLDRFNDFKFTGDYTREDIKNLLI